MKLTRFDSSAAEFQSHMYVALDQGYIAKETFEAIYQQTDKTSKMISGLITYLINNKRNINKINKKNTRN